MDFKKSKPSKNFQDKTALTSFLRARMDMLFDFLSAPKNARKSYMPKYEGRRYKPSPVPVEGPEGNVIKNILLDNYLFEQMHSFPEPGGIYDLEPMGYDDISQDNIDSMNKPLPIKRRRKK